MATKELTVEYTIRTIKFNTEEINECIYSDSTEFVAAKKTAEKEQVDNNLYEFIECLWCDADTGISIKTETRDLNKCECCNIITRSYYETREDRTYNHHAGYEVCNNCEEKFCPSCIFSINYACDVRFCEECFINMTECIND